MLGWKSKPGVHDREVSPLGWAWLVFGVLLALFWGGALRVLGSERHIRQWVEQQLQKENPKVQVEFAFAKLELAQGIWPALGVQFRGLVLKSQEPCSWNGTVVVDQVFIPLHFFKLLQGDVRAGAIEFGMTRVSLQPPLCTPKRPHEVVALKGSTGTPSQHTSKLSQRWLRELMGTFRWLDELHIDAVEVSGWNKDEVYRLSDFHLRGETEPLAFKFSANFKALQGRWTSFFTESLLFKLDGNGDEIRWESSLPMREGMLRTQGQVDLHVGQYVARVIAGQLPLSLILDGLTQLGLVQSPPWPVRRMWLNSKATLAGAVDALSTSPQLSFEVLKVDGESGLISLAQPQSGALTDFFASAPLRLKVERLDIESLLKVSGRQGYRGVIDDFGELVGELKIEGPKSLKFVGELKGLSLRFSRERNRAKQVIPVVRGEWAFQGERFRADIHEVELNQGVLEGKMALVLDPSMRNGEFKVALDKVHFAPEINRLMLGHDEAEWSLHGQGDMREGKVHSWRGEIKIPEVKAGFMSLKEANLITRLAENDVMKVKLSMSGAKVRVDEVPSPQLKSLLVEVAQGAPTLSIAQVRGDVDVFSDGVGWTGGQAQLDSSGWKVQSQGQWMGEAEVDAWLKVFISGRSQKRWRINGLWPDLNVLREASP